MKRHSLFTCGVLALLLGLTACTQEELADGTLPAGEYPVIIQACGLCVTATPQAASATRATVDGDWQGVTSVALQLDGAVKEYTVSASNTDGYRSATLARTDNPFYWPNLDDITVSAWWPYAEALPTVKVAEDQSTLAAFQNSDFISAENQTVTFDAPTLTFTHRTARVTIVLKPGSGIMSVAGATVSLVNLSAEGDNPTAITTCNTAGDTYEALAAPQTIPEGTIFIRVELNNRSFNFQPKKEVVLEPGKRYTYTLNVSGKSLNLTGSSITDWEDGGDEDGHAENLECVYDKETNTCIVNTADNLLAWNKIAQIDQTVNCILAADIDLTGKTWTPIGIDYNHPYIGTFNGQGHTITGLTVNQQGTDYAGLFGCIGSGGTVKNVVLENVQITSDNSSGNAGGVAGSNYGTITACTVSGTVSGGYYAGGVAGYNYGTLTDCTVSGTVSGNNYTGGVAGSNYGTLTDCTVSGIVSGNNYAGGVAGSNNGTLTGCTVSGTVSGDQPVGGVAGRNFGTLTDCTVSGTISGSWYAGGVAGRNFDSGSIEHCHYTDGTVEARDGYYAGGVAGDNDNGTLTDCTASGNVTATNDYAGGVAGDNSGTLTNCYASGTVSGNWHTGGVAGRNYYGTLTNCYASGNVTATNYYYVGGVAGQNYYGTLTNCYATGNVTVTSGNYVGGVTGQNDNGILTNCYATGNATATGIYVGGVAGDNDNGTLTNCYASGNVTATSYYYVGGVAGRNSGTLTGCYATGNVTAASSYYVGGVAGGNDNGTLTACYATSTVSGALSVGGVAGRNNNGTLTACYWSNYDGSGVGNGSGDVTKVDGTTVTWENAQTGMNDAIDTWNAENPDRPCNWQYANASATTPPVLAPAN